MRPELGDGSIVFWAAVHGGLGRARRPRDAASLDPAPPTALASPDDKSPQELVLQGQIVERGDQPAQPSRASGLPLPLVRMARFFKCATRPASFTAGARFGQPWPASCVLVAGVL